MAMDNWTIRTKTYDSSLIGSTRQPDGSFVNLVLLDRGQPAGTLVYGATADLEVRVFDKVLPPSRSVGVHPSDRVALFLMSDHAAKKVFWSRDMAPGHFAFAGPSSEIETFHAGRASYAMISMKPAELMASLSTEPRLHDPGFWTGRWVAPSATSGTDAVERTRRVVNILTNLQAAQGSISDPSADFWRRSIVEAFVSLAPNIIPEKPYDFVRSASRLVREVEHYIDTRKHRPVHISEICSELKVSRRSLHRAFDDVLGIGPVTFFRQKRLSDTYAALRRSGNAQTSVTAVAFEHGFSELGRFAQYYKSQFGELPSETLQRNRHR